MAPALAGGAAGPEEERGLPPRGVRPFLRWAGSKRQLLPVLAAYWDKSYERYVEPFAGSACLFFHIAPSRAVLGDINAELIGAFREVKKNALQVSACLSRLRRGRRPYLTMRAADPALIPAPERAARLIYLNRFCFNGLYRTNRAGRFNVPYGGQRCGTLPTRERLLECSELLRGSALLAGDFGKVLERVRPGDFVYMDPPFSLGSKRTFNEYNQAIFGSDDLVRLRGWMENLANRDISFVVSYAESAEARFLAEGFQTKAMTVRRSIAGFSADRVRSRELLISFAARKKRQRDMPA